VTGYVLIVVDKMREGAAKLVLLSVLKTKSRRDSSQVEGPKTLQETKKISYNGS
jgi:hypothetical protein